MTEVNVTRELRLIMFTSLLRSLNFVSHARVLDCYAIFCDYSEKYPLLEGYTRIGRALDHKNMREFLDNYYEVSND